MVFDLPISCEIRGHTCRNCTNFGDIKGNEQAMHQQQEDEEEHRDEEVEQDQEQVALAVVLANGEEIDDGHDETCYL